MFLVPLFDTLEGPIIVFLVIVAPLWIFAHYGTRWRQQRTLGAAEEKLLSDLWTLAQRMEARIENLERVVDPDARTGAKP